MRVLPSSHVPHQVVYMGGVHEEMAPEGVRELWGVKFPHGVPVVVSDPQLVTKIKAMADIFDIAEIKEPVPVEQIEQPGPKIVAAKPKRKRVVVEE